MFVMTLDLSVHDFCSHQRVKALNTNGLWKTTPTPIKFKERGHMHSQTVYFYLLVLFVPRDKLISVADDENKFYQRLAVITVRPSDKGSVFFAAASRQG